jgi:hypothetical protein
MNICLTITELWRARKERDIQRGNLQEQDGALVVGLLRNLNPRAWEENTMRRIPSSCTEGLYNKPLRAMSRCISRILSAAVVTVALAAAPIVAGTFAPAQARVSAEFHSALDPHGHWAQHARWGEVWRPADRARGWRPYTVGRWVYTNDWGWYWAEAPEEAQWGWVTYHYGRWVFDSEEGWIWVPGDQWGPAFVQWRHGAHYVGWAPMPPDEILVEYRDEPDVWAFCDVGAFATATYLPGVILPVQEYPVFLRETAVVNQTVFLPNRFAVNPGIPAGLIAAAVGHSLRTFDVRPRILAGTTPVPGALQLHAQDLRGAGGNRLLQSNVRQSANVIAPNRAQQIRPLAAGEHGRLGDNPPRAAQAQGAQAPQGRQAQQPQVRPQPAPPTTQGQAQGQGAQQSQQARPQPAQPATEGQAQTQAPSQQQPRQREERRTLQNQQRENAQQGRAAREGAQTQGRAPEERRQAQPERRAVRPAPATEGRREIAPQRREVAPQRSETPAARSRIEGGRAGRAEPPQARPQPQAQRPAMQPSRPSMTEGRGGGAAAAPRAAPQMHAPAGGGGGAAPHAGPPAGAAGPGGGGAGRGGHP